MKRADPIQGNLISQAEMQGRSQLEVLAIRMARARRQRLDAKRFLSGPPAPNDPPATESRVEQAKHELSAARIEWRKATAAIWRLVAKMDRGEA